MKELVGQKESAREKALVERKQHLSHKTSIIEKQTGPPGTVCDCSRNGHTSDKASKAQTKYL